jgi:hypothetical protein
MIWSHPSFDVQAWQRRQLGIELPNQQSKEIMNSIFKKVFTNRLVLVSTFLGFAFPAAAQDDPATDWLTATPIAQTTRVGISPFYGYRFGGEVEDDTSGANYDFEDSPAYGLILDYAPLGYYGRFELLWSHQDSSLDFRGNYGLDEVDLTIDVIQIGGEAEYGNEDIRGYVSAHLGATHFSTDRYGDETMFSFGIGGGVKAFLTKNIYLRADVRGFCTVTDGEASFIFSNGVSVASFSGSTLWQGQVTAGIGFTF